MQAKLQSKITLFLIKPIYELSETMDIRGPKWALKKKIAARKHATPLGAKPPLSLNPRNAPGSIARVFQKVFSDRLPIAGPALPQRYVSGRMDGRKRGLKSEVEKKKGIGGGCCQMCEAY